VILNDNKHLNKPRGSSPPFQDSEREPNAQSSNLSINKLTSSDRQLETSKSNSGNQSSDAQIQIIGINTDKTHKKYGSDTIYEVYLKLSGSPTVSWRTIFEQEWKVINRSIEATVDRGFLVLHCLLKDVVIYLPILKKTFISTNNKYRAYVQKQSTDLELREEVWKQERINLEELTKLLDFA
jgi:hypothetical protein